MPHRDELIGAWELESWRIVFSDEREDTYPYGSDAYGQLIYDPSGRMAVTVSVANRPRMSDDNVRRAPDPEKIMAFDTFFHYGGRWVLGDDEVHHDVEFALNPNFVGTRQTRTIEYETGRLALIETSTTRSGTTMQNRLTWRRRIE